MCCIVLYPYLCLEYLCKILLWLYLEVITEVQEYCISSSVLLSIFVLHYWRNYNKSCYCTGCPKMHATETNETFFHRGQTRFHGSSDTASVVFLFLFLPSSFISKKRTFQVNLCYYFGSTQ